MEKGKEPMLGTQELETPPKKGKDKRKCPLVETSLRRSDRIKQLEIKKLGTQICRMEEEELDKELLAAKRDQKRTAPSTKRKKNDAGIAKLDGGADKTDVGDGTPDWGTAKSDDGVSKSDDGAARNQKNHDEKDG
jgi:hypothetical protein